MCDEDTERDTAEFLKGKLSRRKFNSMAARASMVAGAAIMFPLPSIANALDVIGSDVNITTPDGVADCFFVHPAKGTHPGVIIWPDIKGLRPSYRMMASRLAESGYAVLCVNQFYRSATAPVTTAGESWGDPEVRARIMPMYQAITAATNSTDAKAFVSFLDAQGSVDTSKKIGTTGYCMGCPIVLRTAAAVPDRIGAGATFHGGGLATDKPDSPHHLIPKMNAAFLIAIAENDDAKEPEAKNILRESFASAGLSAEIEVYKDTLHGWCPPDSEVYNEAQAEVAWARLLVLFRKALA